MSIILRLLPVASLFAVGVACSHFTVPLLPTLADPCSEWPESGLYRLPLGDGWIRTPLIYIPPAPPDSGRDAVVMLHGAGGSPEKMEVITLWKQRADEAGLVAVFPSGTGGLSALTWNAGTCCGYAEETNQPDVAFLEATSAAVRSQLCVTSVLAAGHSNGSMMAQRWTCEGAGMDAVIADAGPLLVDTCKGEPVPVQAWAGDADTRVPMAGGTTTEGEAFPPADEAFAKIRARNRCTDDPPEITVDGDTTCSTWSCEASTIFCVVAGGEHDWPGGIMPRGDNPVIEDVALAWFWELTGKTPAPPDTDTPEPLPADSDDSDVPPVDTDPVIPGPTDTDPDTDTDPPPP